MSINRYRVSDPPAGDACAIVAKYRNAIHAMILYTLQPSLQSALVISHVMGFAAAAAVRGLSFILHRAAVFTCWPMRTAATASVRTTTAAV